jgi:hypothetical protein
VELVEEKHLPGAVQLVDRVPPGQSAERLGRCGPQLGIAERQLLAAVGQLGLGMGGVGAPVDLEVELARPDGELVERGVGLDGLEGVVRRDRAHPGRAFQVGQAPGPLEHVTGGAATSVPPAVQVHRCVAQLLLGEVGHPVGELSHREVAHVGVRRREVGEHPGAVDTLPPERVVGEPVDLVPRHLLGQEPADPRQGKDLREVGRVAEHVRQPQAAGLHVHLVGEEALAVDDLADERLAAREVAVRLDPHAPHHLELSLRDLLADPVVETGVVGADPGQLLGL